jgi:hypothetical protein
VTARLFTSAEYIEGEITSLVESLIRLGPEDVTDQSSCVVCLICRQGGCGGLFFCKL